MGGVAHLTDEDDVRHVSSELVGVHGVLHPGCRAEVVPADTVCTCSIKLQLQFNKKQSAGKNMVLEDITKEE
jgi:hypothetical protein